MAEYKLTDEEADFAEMLVESDCKREKYELDEPLDSSGDPIPFYKYRIKPLNYKELLQYMREQNYSMEKLTGMCEKMAFAWMTEDAVGYYKKASPVYLDREIKKLIKGAELFAIFGVDMKMVVKIMKRQLQRNVDRFRPGSIDNSKAKLLAFQKIVAPALLKVANERRRDIALSLLGKRELPVSVIKYISTFSFGGSRQRSRRRSGSRRSGSRRRSRQRSRSHRRQRSRRNSKRRSRRRSRSRKKSR
uniref:Uncharacterized protein n=1 Tax=viral metagenome TaxID=1070528 RepID=A0A6C0EME3_9ZZZZ